MASPRNSPVLTHHFPSRLSSDLGGRAVRENMIYITPEAAAARELVIGTLVRLISEGSVDKMEVTPAYKGRSLVPAAITLRAWHSSKPGSFEPTIQIRSEEHTSELQSLMRISYAVFCLKKIKQ